jgi:thioredoxin 1
MSASAIFRRTLLTSARLTASPQKPQLHQQPLNLNHLYKPLYANFQHFSTTMSKQGVHNLKSKAGFDEALKQEGLMVLDCFATWCGPCKVIAPQVVK